MPTQGSGPLWSNRIVIRGGGDLGSGAAVRLWRCGFSVIVLECVAPMAVRRTVAFSEAVYDGEARVEEVGSRLADRAEDALHLVENGLVAVLVDAEAHSLSTLQPYAVVDAILAKRNTGTSRCMSPITVGLGPGFVAGQDVHAVVETNRGPNLGRVIWQGAAERNSGEPAPVFGESHSRVLRSPTFGTLCTRRSIGDIVAEGEVVACVADQAVRSAFKGMVRGLARNGLQVTENMKIGDIDPRLDPSLCVLVSDKALAVAGGVVEAICTHTGGIRYE